MEDRLIFEKVVDKSALAERFTIPEAYHEALYSHLGRRLRHGESTQIRLLLNGEAYTVRLKNLAFDTQKYQNRSDIVQIRYAGKSPIARALQRTFEETHRRLTASGTAQKAPGIPPGAQEYMMLYATGDPSAILLEPVTVGEIRQEMDRLSEVPEMVIEELLSTDETARMEEKLRVSKVRKMNRAIGESLKQLYGWRCQICGAYIGEHYGSTLIHAHHIDYFSKSMNNDAANIMIVCPNHHGIIHDRNPVFNSANKTYTYPNGYVEGLAINKHL